MDKRINIGLGTAGTIIILAALSRFIPHPPNFTPIMAMAIFGGATFSNKTWAFSIPLLAMFVSDIFISLHTTMIAVYLCFAAGVMIGIFIKEKKSILTVAGAGIVSSVVFFVGTNLGVWLLSGWYPINFTGMVTAFELALPFYHNTLISTLMYSAILFGGYELVLRYSVKKQTI